MVTMPANLILDNADVITLDPRNPKARAVAINKDKIQAVGSRQIIKRFKDKYTRVIDCQGKTLIPGFNDVHCHFFSQVRKQLSLDLSPKAVSSITEIQRTIEQKANSTPEGKWISGTDYNEFYLKEKRHPPRQDLDKASPRHPVIITHRSLHASVLNTLALKMTGITNETEEPPGGIIDRDLETGEPNGILYEMQEYIGAKINNPITRSEWNKGIEQVNRQYLASGITSFEDATITNDFNQWSIYRKLKARGKITSRVRMMLGIKALSKFRETGLISGSGSKNLRAGCLKIILSKASGQIQPDQKELNQMILEATRSGFQVAIHAVEQETVEAAITALENTQRHYPQTELRHRLEHCSECPPDLVKRLAQLKAVVVSQPPFIYYHGDRYLAQVSPITLQWLYPFKSLINSNILVAGSSDSPVVYNNPLIGIYAAITRRAETRKTVTLSEAITIRQALEMYTINAAYAAYEDQIKGSITPGKLADIVMLNENPLLANPVQIKKTAVEMTIIGGEVVWVNSKTVVT
jgi:predicted amidohydrolase YtcJ